MNKRLITALALSMLVMIVFQKYLPQYGAAPPTEEHVEQTEKETVKPPTPRETAMPTEIAAPLEELEHRPEELSYIETDKFVATFSNKGASLKELYLKKSDTNPLEYKLFSADKLATRPFALTTNLISDLEKRPFMVTESRDQLKYQYEVPEEARITKRFIFDTESNQIRFELSLENLSQARLPVNYTLVGPSSLQRIGAIMGRDFLRANILENNDIKEESAVDSLESYTGRISWAALKNRHFTVILRPEQEIKISEIHPLPEDQMFLTVKSDTEIIPADSVLEHNYMFYAGPLNSDLLSAYGYGMERTVDYGFFGFFSRILLNMLRFFHGIVGNWGVSIILLSVIINLLLFPLTKKSLTSMQRMKQLQPHITKLKKLHKDDPQKLNKEMMQLYKKYNVNPLGGCLPMLLQMPIFIALYHGLLRAIELRGAHFLWIRDLGSPDAVAMPFSLPIIGDSINILPLVMIGVMVLQQKISSQGAMAPSGEAGAPNPQKNMMIIMPLVFGVLFYNMPSGLVLYWLTNTITMTIGHLIISKEISDE